MIKDTKKIQKNSQVMRLYLSIFILIMSSCQSETSFQFSTYWWKNSTELNKEHKEFLNKNNINKIYLRIFDLKFDQKNQSILIPKVNAGLPVSSIKTIPVIYIENAILSNFSVDTIYNIILRNINNAKDEGIIKEKNELQVDCDWTLKTKSSYFKLLSLLSKEIKVLSATIRLHQIKYAKSTGIPPVNKGVMMIYNLDSPSDTNTQNSIFTYNKAIQYLDEYLKKYLSRTKMQLDSDWEFYIIFSLFKVAGICQGILGRVRDGTAASEFAIQMGKRAIEYANLGWEKARKIS